ncbi:MAG: YHS domain-containing (seleno)protein [Acidobacteriota bacterium]
MAESAGARRRSTMLRRAAWPVGLTLAAAALVVGVSAAGAVDPINTGWFGNTAIKGYDPVAYFELGQPTPGDKAITADWNGATWRFSSAEHRAKFVADPAAYAPQYGGYCAYAVAEGSTAGIDPESWAVVDGKLYLNYNAKIQAKWEANRDQMIAAADEQWPKLLSSD